MSMRRKRLSQVCVRATTPCRAVSPRYRRRGALHLFAGLSAVDGEVFGGCQQRKRFVDFQHFLLKSIIAAALQRGGETLVLILDGGPTHAPKRFVAWLAE
jgi:hypothetical protein